ncbi:uncharacterized protein LOC124321118 [Daphnia pulicaria]|uniref:uncharacterized protein LOC124321118 n=1 Tax=Daphnia pulicaria TaxID=35523 RepID=UPI001EEA8C22|nr:uncharacterized protein LOC124321118 [Daphnia pulicaria]
MSTSDDECDKEIPLLKIDVAQLLVENVTIGKDGAEREIEAVIDTGAAVSIVSPRIAADLALELKTWGGPSIVMVNRQRTPPLGRVELSLTIGTKSIKADLLVLEMKGIDVLLGNDVLRRFKTLEIEYGTGKPKMRFGELPVSLVLEDPHTGPTNKIIASKGIRIPARSMAAVEVVQNEAVRESPDGRPWLIEPTRRTNPGPTPGRALLPGDRLTTLIPMMNLENRPVFVHKGMVLGHRTEIRTEGTEISEDDRPPTPRACMTTTEQTPKDLDFRASINQDLTEEEIDDIERALRDNGDCFARDGDQLGRCNVAEHEIHLIENAGPIYQAPRQTSRKEEEIQRDLTTEMLRKKVIARASGPWGARVLLLQKKDGTWRFCLDFRPLNGITIFSVYPMPNIDRTLSRLHGAKIFSVMDLESGYWQIPMRKEDREKTAFVTADGTFHFLVMPFGLCTAQATFQRTMDMVLGGLRWTACLVYLDDIIV